MGNSCSIIPKVNGNDGSIKDSRLFKDLLSFSNNDRNAAVNIYLRTKSDKFITDFKNKLQYDEYGEPTLSSIINNLNIDAFIPDDKVIDTLNKKIWDFNKKDNKPILVEDTYDNYTNIVDKAISFNRNSEFSKSFVAIVEKTTNDSGTPSLYIKIERRNRKNTADADNMENARNLNKRIREILDSHGIRTGALTDLEKRLGIAGVTDFNQVKSVANGIIELIRLANGSKGESVLPEEFAHFALDAVSDNPLVNRLINLIAEKGLVSEILGNEYNNYKEIYDDDTYKMAKEAAGKLVARHFINGKEIQPKPYKNLLQRLIEHIKKFFSSFNSKDIVNAISDADKYANQIAKELISGNLGNSIDINNIKSTDKLYNLQNKVKRDMSLLSRIITNEMKRLKIISGIDNNSEDIDRQRNFITELINSLQEHEEIEGVFKFVDNAVTMLKDVKKRLYAIATDIDSTNNQKAKSLREIRNNIYSYRNILKDIRTALIQDENEDGYNRYNKKIKNAVDELSALIDDTYSRYKEVSMPIVAQFLKEFVGDSITFTMGKWKGVTVSIEDIVKGKKLNEEGELEWFQEEISIADRWLDSMAESSDYMVKILGNIIKDKKEVARRSTIDLSKRIKMLGLKLESEGITNTDWMFERDSNGNLTGRYISDIDYSKYYAESKAFFDELSNKYKDELDNGIYDNYEAERDKWVDKHTVTVDGVVKPDPAKYNNPAFENLSDAQKEFHKEFMSIKSELDSYLPPKKTNLYNIIKIRKDVLERVINSKGVTDGAKQLWEAMKDEVVRRSDDIGYSDNKIIKDFEGNKLNSLPIYYINIKDNENMNDISTDAISTLISYASMAIDYKEMNNVINSLELTRDMLKEREIITTENDIPIIETIKGKNEKYESPLSNTNTRNLARINSLFDMQVYGRYLKDEGTFGKTNIDKAKAVGTINKMTALSKMALNCIIGISNVAVGSVMTRIESFSKEFFTPSNVLHADREYIKNMPKLLSEIGSRAKTGKLSLWCEKFNVLNEYEKDINNTNFDRNKWYKKMFSSSVLFFMNNAGEHWLQNRTSLALADNYILYDSNHNPVKLWDAYDVKYFDVNKPQLGAELVLNNTYYKEDGTLFTDKDEIAFTNKCHEINNMMHGIYNDIDKNAIQNLAVGRMAIMFRKHIKPSLVKRFKGASYNYQLQENVEGYYRTLFNLFVKSIKELRQSQFTLVTNYKNLSNTEKANIRRAITELGHLIVLFVVLSLFDLGDDDDNESWLYNMTELQTRRLFTDIGAFTPGLQMLEEGRRILKSPAASIDTIDTLIDLIKSLFPSNWFGEDAIIQSGRYKGHTHAYKFIMEALPIQGSIYKNIYPEELIPYYKQ